MKKRFLILFIALCSVFVAAPTKQVQAIAIVEIIKQAIVKVIKAVDLMIQRLQNATIKLQNAQKELENAMSKLKLKEISEWAEKQRKLYDDYYQELWRVKTAIAYYQRIKEIINGQRQLVTEYQSAIALFRKDKHFSQADIDFMSNVYGGILAESIKNLDEIMLVINSFATQMSDAKRLELISHASTKLEENLGALRSFNQHNIGISLSKAKDQYELAMLKQLYGLP
jgi:hypothetical protein